MFAYFESPLSWTELAKRTYREMSDDDAFGLAAQLAYYFFLALFPAILCMLALASFLPLHNFTDEVLRAAARFAPQEMLGIIREQMMRLAEGKNGGIATIGAGNETPFGKLYGVNVGCLEVVSEEELSRIHFTYFACMNGRWS